MEQLSSSKNAGRNSLIDADRAVKFVEMQKAIPKIQDKTSLATLVFRSVELNPSNDGYKMDPSEKHTRSFADELRSADLETKVGETTLHPWQFT